MRVIISLLAIAATGLAEGPCDASTVQSVVESFFSRCIPNKPIDWQDNCWEVFDDNIVKRRGCEWANRINAALFMKSAAPLCDSARTTAVDVNTSLVSIPRDLCTISTGKIENCTQATTIATLTYPADLSSDLTCGCLESHLQEIQTCQPIFDIISTPELVLDARYYNFTEFRSDSACLLTCDLEELAIVETSDSMLYNLEVTIRNSNTIDLFKTVISTITGGELQPSQVFVKYWQEVADSPNRFTVHFALVNVPTARLAVVISDVNVSLSNSQSIIRSELAADPTLLVPVPATPSPSPVIIIEKKDEVPTYMIVLCIVFGVLLLVIAAAFAIDQLGGGDDDEEGTEEEEEMEDGKELPEDEEAPNAA